MSSRSRVRLYLASFCVDASSYSFSQALKFHAVHRFDASYSQLGNLGALASFSYSLTCLFTGRWSDRVGSLPLAVTGLILMALLAVASRFITTLDQIYTAGSALGMTLALYWPPIHIKISMLSPGRRLLGALGVFNLFWTVGVGFGSYLAPAVYEYLSFQAAVTFSAGLAVLALAAVAAPMPEPSTDTEEPDDQTAQERDNHRSFQQKTLLFLYIARMANFSAFFALGAVSGLIQRIGIEVDIPMASVGLVLGAMELGKFLAFIVLRVNAAWQYSFRWIFTGQLVAGGALVISGMTTQLTVLLVLLPLVGAFSGLSYFSSLYYGLNLRRGEGRRSGIHETILSSGVCFGPLVCGWIGTLMPSYPGASLIFAGLVLVVFLGAESIRFRSGFPFDGGLEDDLRDASGGIPPFV